MARYLFYLVFFILLSCNAEVNDHVEIVEDGILSLQLPQYSSLSSYCLTRTNEDQLYISPNNLPVVYKVDLKTQSIIDEFVFESVGPDGVGDKFNFSALRDSLIIFSKFSSVARVFDWGSKEFVSKIRFRIKSPCNRSTSSSMRYTSYPIVDEHIFLPLECDINYNDSTEFNEARIILDYQIKDKSHEYFVKYPMSYSVLHPSIYELMNASFLRNKDLLVYNFPTSDSLYLYDLVDKKPYQIFAKSKSHSIDRLRGPKINDFFKYEENGSYPLLLYYDKWKVYIRFVKYLDPENWSKFKGGSMGEMAEGIFSSTRYSIIFFDENFKYLAEQDLDEDKTLWPFSNFFYKDRLYIQLVNYGENEGLHFQAFDLVY